MDVKQQHNKNEREKKTYLMVPYLLGYKTGEKEVCDDEGGGGGGGGVAVFTKEDNL